MNPIPRAFLRAAFRQRRLNGQGIKGGRGGGGGGGQGRWLNFYSADISKKMLSSLAHRQLFRHVGQSVTCRPKVGGIRLVFRAAD